MHSTSSYRPFLFSNSGSIDGTERQLYLDADGNKPRPKIKAAHVADPFIVVMREDETFGLFVGDTAKGRVRRKDVSHFGENVSLTFFLSMEEFQTVRFRAQYASRPHFSRTTPTCFVLASLKTSFLPVPRAGYIAASEWWAIRRARNARRPMLGLETLRVQNDLAGRLLRLQHTRTLSMPSTGRSGLFY